MKKFYAKCEKKFDQLHDQSDGQFGQLILVGIFGFRGVNVNIFGKCHDLERKCKMLVKGWAEGIFLAF